MEDPWELGEAYERFMGRWSRPVARTFLRWLDEAEKGCWLDVGCGTGALSELIGQTAAPQSIIGVDFSPQTLSATPNRKPSPTTCAKTYQFRPAAQSP
jgi:trans-aconitate methyltransferase